MKNKSSLPNRAFLAVGVGSLVLLLSPSAHAQAYGISSYRIAGGGTSAGGVYSVSGSLGQADAGGPLSNGPYTVSGGFWALPIAVQTVGAPLLSIVS